MDFWQGRYYIFGEFVNRLSRRGRHINRLSRRGRYINRLSRRYVISYLLIGYEIIIRIFSELINGLFVVRCYITFDRLWDNY